MLPDDLDPELALAVLDVCGAPALTDRVVRGVRPARAGSARRGCVIGGAGKSGSLSLAAARRAGAPAPSASCRPAAERDRLADGRPGRPRSCWPTPATRWRWPRRSTGALGGPADVTVVCVDVPGCEHGAILATADGGTVIFFSMATSFSAAALGAEGLAADVTMLIGNGYVPGHAAFALDLLRAEPGGARGCSRTACASRPLVPDRHAAA